MSSYLLKFKVSVKKLSDDSHSRFGITLHSSEEGRKCLIIAAELMTDKISYSISGTELLGAPITFSRAHQPSAATSAPTTAGTTISDSWQVLVQGDSGCVFVNGKSVRQKFKLKTTHGIIGFTNSSNTEVVFDDVMVSCLQRTFLPQLIPSTPPSTKVGRVEQVVKGKVESTGTTAKPAQKPPQEPSLLDLYIRPRRHLKPLKPLHATI